VFGPALSSLTSPCIFLESHVQVLQDSNKSIPQPVAMLLAEARSKEDETQTVKRVANSKSACTSRARKIEEMTRTNARLKRQAMILALLPDLVITITIDGGITFCSAQVSLIYYDNMRCWIHFIVFFLMCYSTTSRILV
jgi:hypothetical protein